MNQLSSSYADLNQYLLLSGPKYVEQEVKFRFVYASFVTFLKKLVIKITESLTLSKEEPFGGSYDQLPKCVREMLLSS